MQNVKQNKGVSSSVCYVCGQKGHMRRDTAISDKARNNLELQAVRQTKQVRFEQKK